MAKKYYVVKVGKSVGIYNNWEDCKKQVTGFSGAIYKSFPTLEEAKEYLNNENIEVKSGGFNLEDIAEAIKLKKKKITVFYDYQGISSWANGEWKCNLPLTIGYRDKIKEFRKEIEILFVKVKAHSNDKYNDLADYLAKKSLGIEK